MKIVSKEWQDFPDERSKDVYEYQSLCDRELYDILSKHWKQIKQDAADQGQHVG